MLSNAENVPRLKLSLKCTIRSLLGFEPGYLSLKPDKNGYVHRTLTVTTRKKDLVIKDVVFQEHKGRSNRGTNWQDKLPLHLNSKLTRSDTTFEDGYVQYKLDLTLQVPDDHTTTYGEFTVKSNHPKRNEVTLKGVILKKEVPREETSQK